MKASALYLVTAIATGIHVFYLAMWSNLGRRKILSTTSYSLAV